jgi:DNA polymerase III subunit beta
MKLVLFQENFSKALNLANRFISSRTQLPILENFLFKAEKDGFLKISATNLETGINLKLAAKVIKTGEICVPARVLTEFVSSLPSGKIELLQTDNKLEVKTDKFSSEFLGISTSEYPAMPEKTKSKEIVFEKDSLLKAIAQVCFSASADDSRPILTGVLFTVRDNKLLLVSTDGYRLSLKTLTKAPFLETEEGLVIPAKTLLDLSKVIDLEDEENISLNINKKSNQLVFTLGETEVISQLIGGEYPDFERIVPKSGKITATLDSKEFLQAVKISSIFAKESANIIKLKFSKNSLEITSNTSQVGTNKNTISAEVEGGEIEVAFNFRYLLEFLNTVKEETLEVKMESNLSPVLFEYLEDKDFCHIIMPVKLQD